MHFIAEDTELLNRTRLYPHNSANIPLRGEYKHENRKIHLCREVMPDDSSFGRAAGKGSWLL